MDSPDGSTKFLFFEFNFRIYLPKTTELGEGWYCGWWRVVLWSVMALMGGIVVCDGWYCCIHC